MMMVSSFVAARLASDAAIIPSMLPPRCIVDKRVNPVPERVSQMNDVRFGKYHGDIAVCVRHAAPSAVLMVLTP
jgi:hypothetical protein